MPLSSIQLLEFPFSSYFSSTRLPFSFIFLFLSKSVFLILPFHFTFLALPLLFLFCSSFLFFPFSLLPSPSTPLSLYSPFHLLLFPYSPFPPIPHYPKSTFSLFFSPLYFPFSYFSFSPTPILTLFPFPYFPRG